MAEDTVKSNRAIPTDLKNMVLFSEYVFFSNNLKNSFILSLVIALLHYCLMEPLCRLIL